MKRSIKKSYAQIMKTYTSLMKSGKNLKMGSTAEWLLDNFYVFTKEYHARKSFIKTTGKTYHDHKRMLSWAKSYLENHAYEIEEEDLHLSLHKEGEKIPFSSASISIIPQVLLVTLFSEAASLSRTPEKESYMGNIIKSLFILRELDMKSLFQAHSPIDIMLSADSTFPHMTFATKSQYRNAVDAFASMAGKRDTFVAKKALELSNGKKGKAGHVGYYLIGEGENQLRTLLSLPEKKRETNPGLYIGSVFLLSFLFLFVLYTLGVHWIWLCLSLFPTLDASIQIIQYCLLRKIPARMLPRLSLSEGIPEKILVVYPTLLSSPKKAEEMVRKLERCYLANRDDALQFAVLGDFKDSKTQEIDSEILSVCKSEISRLNEKYGDRFHAFCREPIYAPLQKKWMGEERKRGALCALNRCLRGSYTFPYSYGKAQNLKDTQYVLTLDDDTILPPGVVKKLAGVALHPQNKPICENGVVKSGYGIIQPRVSLQLESTGRTFFSRVFAGQGGIDTYHTAVSEFYMDMFGESVFTGKGIYHVDTFLSCISFPKDTVLSHDLLEGSYVRCGLASDIQVFDGFPPRFTDFSKRQHRWIRGDWQILPWLFAKVRNEQNEVVKNPLSPLSKWKIFDNMRRSMTPILNLILLACGNTTGMLVALFSIVLPILFALLGALAGKHFYFFGEKRASNIIFGVRSAFYQATLSIAFLAHTAYNSFSATLLGIRRCKTKRNTLEWVTASDTERGQKHSLYTLFSYMWFSFALGLFLILRFFFTAPYPGGIRLIFGLVWALSPALAYIVSQETAKETLKLSQKQEQFLRETAEKIWKFFTESATEAEHFLPPDNIQIKPDRGVAHRTSPTNIGLGLLSALCACDLGFIQKDEMMRRISAMVQTIEALPKWHGHLYNWYDTQTLSPLSPRYISTVDSGNLGCYMITVMEGIKAYEGAETPLYKRLEKLVYAMDFRPLYNKKKKLFSIGFSLEENVLSGTHYDLLISEARQTGFLAIALGQIEPAHWFMLGRGLTSADGYRGLMSWSGTMFEYFMPLLIMKNYDNSLLNETYRFAVRCQKRAGRKMRLPWGISESGFYAFDNEGNYQYKAFGVEELRLSRQDPDEAVISPYSSFLALPVDPKNAISNLEWLRKEGAYGKYGFYEAVDFTQRRLHGNMKRGIVKSFMAHHLGMSLAAITNVLCENSLQKRFHSHPAISAADPLLKERVPVCAPIIKELHAKTLPVRYKWQASESLVRTFERETTYPKSVQLISNGDYHVHINTDGEGCSSLDTVCLNSFSPRLGGGQSIKILNISTGQIWDGYGKNCIFHENRAEYRGEENAVSSHLTVSVCEHENAEIRRLSLLNKSDKPKTLEVYFYTSLAIAPKKAEEAHPAFSKLFVITKEKNGVLYAVRRKRSAAEKTFVGFATVTCEGYMEGGLQFETDDLEFWGRCNPLPDKIQGGSILSGKTGTVLNPCFAFKIRLTLPAGMSSAVRFITGLAESEEKGEHIAEKLRSRQAFDKEEKGADPGYLFKKGEEKQFLRLASYLIYGNGKTREMMQKMRENTLPQTALWKLGISGDYPIVTLRLTQLEDEDLLLESVKALLFWENHGIRADLVVFCDEPAGYTHPLLELAEKYKTQHMFVLSRKDFDPGEQALLLAFSTIYIDRASGGFAGVPAYQETRPVSYLPKENQDGELDRLPLLFENGYGGFCEDTGEYVIEMTKAGQTPMPWVHVVANERFGFVAGEGGGGYTWYENSQKFRITPWYNDPIKDFPTETLTLTDKQDTWSPMASVFHETGKYRTRYGMGYAIYERNTRGIYHKVTLFTPLDAPQKIIQVELENKTAETKNCAVRYSLVPTLGTHPQPDKISILKNETCIRFRNAFYDTEKEVFLYGEGDCAYGGDGYKVHAQKNISLKPGAKQTFCFVIGIGKPENIHSEALYNETVSAWKKRLSALTVDTKDPAMHFLYNGWLLYQALVCRIYARGAFYQCGGGYGFRDQLQDALAFIDIEPALVKKQILLHAAHQFEEGDVFHWWHTDETGVRTRFADDRLFLPYVACIYAEETGDTSIWDAEESFVIEPPLSPGEEERYTYVKERTKPYSIYEHCVRAIEISLEKGPNGLPLMGGGDWNDGMNQVGILGQGESVWLCWFLKVILDKFEKVAESRGDMDRSKRYKTEALLLLEAAESGAWDGNHYARAFYDDGSKMGTSASAECAIDAISQAWAVLAAGIRPVRQKMAMDSVWKHLVDHEKNIIKLLSPPFSNHVPSPGYIQSYPKGLRENGGQYTHGAIWVVIAYCLLGEKEKAMELFNMLNPILRTKTNLEANIYKTEPYVMTADIYTAEGHEGRGGWSWYTGAAAWMYRLGIRYILGFCRQGDTVSFSPVFPTPFSLHYRYGKTEYVFHVHGSSAGLKLTDDGGKHEITVGKDKEA